MANVSLIADFAPAINKLTALEKKQIPFAMSVALNNTATKAQARAKQGLKKYLDRPTPFTQSGIGVVRSNKRNLKATVFIKQIQYEYLKYALDGGTRRGNIILPRDIQLNAYGNRKTKIRTLLGRPNHFIIDDSKGHEALYKRFKSGRLSKLASFRDRATYKPRYPFERLTLASARRYLGPEFKKSLERALSTAR